MGEKMDKLEEIWEAEDEYGRKHRIIRKGNQYFVESYPIMSLSNSRRQTYGAFANPQEAQRFLEVHDGIEPSKWRKVRG